MMVLLASRDQVGLFRIEKLLARGQTGVVYVAFDTRLERPVALKQIAAGAALWNAADLTALREAARSCPALVPVDGIEEWDEERYLVMPYVPGVALSDLVKDPSGVGLERLLTILTEAGVALDALHDRGLAHGRLSRANLRVAPGGAEPAVYVTGLGVVDARLASSDAADDRAAYAHLAYDVLVEFAAMDFDFPAALADERLAGVETCAAIMNELADALAAARAARENVQFTVYRPAAIEPDRWSSLLAFAHVAAGGQPPDAADPLEEVGRQAEAVLGAAAATYQRLTQDSRTGVPRAGELTFRLVLPGLEVNPSERSFRWIEDVHREEFRIRAPHEFEGTTRRGEFTVWLGPVLIAEVPLAFRVQTGVVEQPNTRVTMRPYRRIFASYSHLDAEIVQEVEGYCAALGEEYLRDVTTLRSGEKWGPRIKQMIREADIFQLFWSTNAMRSEYVRHEWEYALALSRTEFIRPTYWEDPMPQAGGLPPKELLALHFYQLPIRRPQEGVDRTQLEEDSAEHHREAIAATDSAPLGLAPPAAPSHDTLPNKRYRPQGSARHRLRRFSPAHLVSLLAVFVVGIGLVSAVPLVGGGRQPSVVRAARPPLVGFGRQPTFIPASRPPLVGGGRQPTFLPAPRLPLEGIYTSLAGPSISIPKGWVGESFGPHENVNPDYWETLDVADQPSPGASEMARVVFGSPDDFTLNGVADLDGLLSTAHASLAEQTSEVALRFGLPLRTTLVGAPAAVQEVDWNVSPSRYGQGFVFATRHAITRTWVYGWALYATSDMDEAGVAERMETLQGFISSIRW